ncbi:MAG: hypothetical protein J5608_03120 [Alphaproteobacteria bacterium]|nr:hypothetical protein [Alphaproteobacteria bacterium]
MKKLAVIFAVLPFSAMAQTDAGLELMSAISNSREKCSNISADLDSIRKLVGAETAVNAVGTVAGVGGVVSGVAKQQADIKIAKAMGEKSKIESIRGRLQEQELSAENQDALQKFADIDFNLSKIESDLNKVFVHVDMGKYRQQNTMADKLDKQESTADKRIAENQHKSDVLGGVRTGMFATNTATNVAGAVMSSKATVDATLDEKVRACLGSMQALETAHNRMRFEDGENADTDLLNIAENALEKCGQYKNINMTSINKLSKGSMITGSVGAVTGAAATIASIVGTSKKVSNIDFMTEEGQKDAKKFDNANMASNALGGVTAATSLVSTALNAKQVKDVKQIITVAEECEGALH